MSDQELFKQQQKDRVDRCSILKFANNIMHSDVEPYEIVKVVSAKTLEIRRMQSVRSNPENNLGFVPGGFVGHWALQHEQKWTITPCTEAQVIRIRLGKNGWKDSCGLKFQLSDTATKFHDYNY